MNRTAVINERVATRMPLGASVAGLVRGGGATVGVLGFIGPDEVSDYGSAVNARFKATDAAMASWLVKKYGPGAITKNPNGTVSFNIDDMESSDAQFVVAWKNSYALWAGYWEEQVGSKPLPGEAGKIYDHIADHDATVRDFQQKLNARGGSVYVDPTPPKKSDGSNANPLSVITETISSVIWMLGIGIAVYLGLMYVVPALVGAAATSRSAARGYREA